MIKMTVSKWIHCILSIYVIAMLIIYFIPLPNTEDIDIEYPAETEVKNKGNVLGIELLNCSSFYSILNFLCLS